MVLAMALTGAQVYAKNVDKFMINFSQQSAAAIVALAFTCQRETAMG